MDIDALLERRSMAGHSFKVKSAVEKFILQLREDVKHIKIPILILHGIHDKVCHPSSANYIYDNTQTPPNLKKLVFLKKSAHNLTVDYDKMQVFEESAKFIEVAEKEYEKINKY